jgi:hypothetical protein
MPISKKANTPARKRQWHHVEEAQLARGKSPKIAAMSANAAVRDTPAKKKR